MSRFVLWAVLAISCLGAAVGCTICQNPDDCTYSAFGGIVERQDMHQGRVGSLFAPAEADVAWSEEVPKRDDERNPPTEPKTEETEPGLETSY